MERWLRHRQHGTIYGWDPILAANPKVEEVTEQEAFPEKFITPHVEQQIKKARGRPKKLDLTTIDIPEKPVYTNPVLNADASRRLPK